MDMISEYLNQVINYGGIPTARRDVIADMKEQGATVQQINLWFAGYESMPGGAK